MISGPEKKSDELLGGGGFESCPSSADLVLCASPELRGRRPFFGGCSCEEEEEVAVTIGIVVAVDFGDAGAPTTAAADV